MRGVFLIPRLGLALSLVLATNACSKAASGIGGGSSGIGANIFGQVSQSTTVAFVPAPASAASVSPTGFFKNFRKGGQPGGDVSAQAVSGCTVTAYDLLTNAVVAT